MNTDRSRLQSTNTDVKIVVASYLVMFLYVSLTLGGGIPWHYFFGEDGAMRTAGNFITRTARRLFKSKGEAIEESDEAPPSVSDDPTSKTLRIVAWLPTFLSVNSKFSLGLFGIIIVLVAVSSSVGFFSLLGVRVTLIIAEVIPFLVLAVGVDNVFILVHELDRQNTLHGPGMASRAVVAADDDVDAADEDSILADERSPSHLPPEERVARALARMGPSILLSSVTEVVAFGLGALVPMPAVRNFALYAAGSVLLGATLQVTVFISAMALDLKRVEVSDRSSLTRCVADVHRLQSMRMDCFPCIQLQKPIALQDTPPVGASEGLVAKFIRRYYAPFLLRKEVKQLVVAAFGGLFLLAIVGMQRITMGLGQ